MSKLEHNVYFKKHHKQIIRLLPKTLKYYELGMDLVLANELGPGTDIHTITRTAILLRRLANKVGITNFRALYEHLMSDKIDPVKFMKNAAQLYELYCINNIFDRLECSPGVVSGYIEYDQYITRELDQLSSILVVDLTDGIKYRVCSILNSNIKYIMNNPNEPLLDNVTNGVDVRSWFKQIHHPRDLDTGVLWYTQLMAMNYKLV